MEDKYEIEKHSGSETDIIWSKLNKHVNQIIPNYYSHPLWLIATTRPSTFQRMHIVPVQCSSHQMKLRPHC